MRPAALALAGLLGLGAAAGPAWAIDGVALVLSPDGTRAVRACTGVLFTPTVPGLPVYVLGAEHCLEGGASGTRIVIGASLDAGGEILLQPGGWVAPVAGAQVVRADSLDLFFAPVDVRAHAGDGIVPLATFAQRLPYPGNRVDVLGFPGGVGPVKQRCIYQGAWLEADDGLSHFRIEHELACDEREVWQGLSGGPVLDRDERVIGIVQSTNRAGDALYFAAVLKANIGRNERQPLRMGEQETAMTYERVRLGRSDRVFEIAAHFADGLLDGAMRVTRDGVPHADLNFQAGRLHGGQVIYRPGGGPWVEAQVFDGRLSLDRFADAEAFPDDGDRVARVAQILNWALQGESLD